MIEQERIDAIKAGADLVKVIESRGIALKKNGKGYMGLCPFHKDATPSLSVTPEKGLWQCFGCGAGGDVIRFVELFDKVGFSEAVKALEAEHPALKTPAIPIPPDRLPEERVQLLLNRAITIYEKNFDKDPARTYLNARHITDAGLFSTHRAGYCDGTLTRLLPEDGRIRDDLKTIGILNRNGHEHFSDCIVFPVFDTEGRITTLYGRRINGTDPVRHLYLKDRPSGLWNVGAIKTSPEIILVESILDGLSVQMAGIFNVVSTNGANGLGDDDIELFKRHGVRKLTILFDGDGPGTKAAGRLKEKLSGLSFEIRALPKAHDPNSYLTAFGAQKLASFIHESPQDVRLEPKMADHVQMIPNGFMVAYGMRTYKIFGLDRAARRLKAVVRLEYANRLPFVDTVDFYSARARKTLVMDICASFNEVPENIAGDIARLMLVCEQMSARLPEGPGSNFLPEPFQMSAQEKKEANAFGKSPDLIQLIIDDIRRCGLVGEDANALLGYFVMSSRKRMKTLCMMILSSSGAGKSQIQDTAIGFCPPEDLIKRTVLSGKALFYKEEDSLKHKVLAIEEGDGASDAFYAIRSLISSGVLTTETTVKDLSTGRLTTMENRVEGPAAVFYTTTNPYDDPETKSRFFLTGVDESREQTRRIQSLQCKQQMENDLIENMEIEAIRRKHWNFQRLLKPIGVKNPYGDQLTYGDDRLQGRRDHLKYHLLIKTVSHVRQMQKEIRYDHKNGQQFPYVETDPEDIRQANRLMHRLFGKRLTEMSHPGLALLANIEEMVIQMAADQDLEKDKVIFTRRDIREFSGWSHARVHRYLKELVDLEYVLIVSGRNGSRYHYQLAYDGQGKDGQKFILGLTPVDKLHQTK